MKLKELLEDRIILTEIALPGIEQILYFVISNLLGYPFVSLVSFVNSNNREAVREIKERFPDIKLKEMLNNERIRRLLFAYQDSRQSKKETRSPLLFQALKTEVGKYLKVRGPSPKKVRDEQRMEQLIQKKYGHILKGTSAEQAKIIRDIIDTFLVNRK